jgi:hypothetical protein
VVAGYAAGATVVTGVCFATPALAATPAEIAAETSSSVAGTPCTAAASACVDVNAHKAWLIKNGAVVRGPVRIDTGGKGEDTPTGNVFRVYRKDKDFKSTEFKLPNGQPAPMPYSVFFEDGGIAFHAGDPNRASAGCVHLYPADAQAFYNFLQIGDHVQVMDGPVSSDDIAKAVSDNGDNGNGSHAHSGDGGHDDGHSHGGGHGNDGHGDSGGGNDDGGDGDSGGN